MTGIEMRHVPYRGAGPALQDVIAGRLDAIFDNIAGSLPQVTAGNARGLAVTTLKRSGAAPDVPTLAEAGVPGFDVSAWFGFYAPAKTPKEIVQKLNTDIVGADVVGSTPEGLAQHIKSEMDKWGPVIRDAGIRIDG
jgi:tripartite-type tricarboxylate transporter receptor subunit TctC